MTDNKRKKWDLLFRHHINPCMITHRDTGELLYYNQKCADLFDWSQKEVGKNFYTLVLPEDVDLGGVPPDWNEDLTFSSESYNKKLNLSFLMNATLLDDEIGVFCEMIPAESQEDKHRFEEAMTQCMEIYTQSGDTVLLSLMQYLSVFFDSEAAYIYRFDTKKNVTYCVAQWTEDEKYQVKQELPMDFGTDTLISFITEKSIAGIVVADSESSNFDHTAPMSKNMRELHIKNLTFSAVEDTNHNIIGLVGLSNRRDMKRPLERRLLTAISHFVAQDVLKGFLSETLFELHHRDHLTGLFNRTGYAKRIDQIMSESPTSLGVIMANVNGLKYINENIGITGGDDHIKKSARQIKDHFGFEIFRMSGDEFIGVAPNIHTVDFEEKVMALFSKMKQEDTLG